MQVLQEVNSERQIIIHIWRRQLPFSGHVMRREDVEKVVTTEKIESVGDRSRHGNELAAKWHGKQLVC